MDEQNQTQNELKKSADALKICKSNIDKFLRMYNAQEINKDRDNAIRHAIAIYNCLNIFTEHFNTYYLATNNK